MGKRGPKKQPPAVKIANGTYRQDRDNAMPINPQLPQMPDWLSEESAAIWTKVIDELSKLPGLLEPVDAYQLSRYCDAWLDFWAACRAIESEGIIATSATGSVYQHPAVGIKNKASDRLSKFEARYCMTPVDRAGVSLSDAIPDDPAAEFLA